MNLVGTRRVVVDDLLNVAALLQADKLQVRRVALLERIAWAWRGHWGNIDGRVGKDWILTALHGDAAALDGLDADLDDDESEYV